MKSQGLLVMFALLAVAFAGCTDGGTGDPPSDPLPEDGGAAGTMPEGEAEPKTHHVSIEDFAFDQGSLSITEGDTVVWTNADSVTHTVDSTDGTATLDSGNMAEGDTFTFTFDEPGTFTYRCDIHPSMEGEVVVTSLAAT